MESIGSAVQRPTRFGGPGLQRALDVVRRGVRRSLAAVAGRTRLADGRPRVWARWLWQLIELELAIVKVDPSPAPTGGTVTVVCQLWNFLDVGYRVRLGGFTDEGIQLAKATVDLPPYGEAVALLSASWDTSGPHAITVQASRERAVPGWTPGGERTTVLVYDSPVTDQAGLAVYTPGSRNDVPLWSDAGPTGVNGTVNSGNERAGVIQAVAGSDAFLYCVSKTAGVWRSERGGAWRQLAQSPPGAFCLAVDPEDPLHVYAGEREAAGSDKRLNPGGLWLSTDGGDNWDLVWDPFPSTGSHLIRALEFNTDTRTLFIATDNGVARRPSGGGVDGLPVELPSSEANSGQITALAIGDGRMWARTVGRLLFSDDDGLTWTSIPIAKTVDIPNVGNGLVVLLNGGSDATSLAAFGNTVLVVFTPRLPDPQCDRQSSQFDPNKTDCDPLDNRCAVLVLDVAANTWHAEVLADGNGTGLGGRRFVKLFRLRGCPGYLAGTVGQSLRLYYGSGQGIQEAREFDPATNTFTWDDQLILAGTYRFHSDIWDLHLSDDFCPTWARFSAWIATDGGIFRAAYGEGGDVPPLLPLGRLAGFRWYTMNDGLHTHNIHTVTVLQNDVGSPLLAYATADNGAWFRRADGSWVSPNLLGDANYTVGEVGSPSRAVAGRSLTYGQVCGGNEGCSLVTDFAAAGGGLSLTQMTVDWNGAGAPPTDFQPVAVPPSGDLPSDLDMVLLTNLPLTDADGNALPDGPDWNQGPALVLLRNRQFQSSPDGPASHFSGWSVEVPDVPVGATRVWVTGGREVPDYYFFASNRDCLAGLFKRDTSNARWNRDCLIGGLLDGGTYGAAFVNPFDRRYLYVAATDATHPKGVIKRSADGGATFVDDEVLTALVTASGKYGFGGFDPGGTLGPAGSTSHANTTNALAQIAFRRTDPNVVVAVSPFTGAFYRNYAIGCLPIGPSDDPYSRVWKDLTPYLPQPISAAVCAGLDGGGAYIGTEGRGLVFVDRLEDAPPATFFRPDASVTIRTTDRDVPVPLGTLFDSMSTPVPYGQVAVSSRQTRSGTEYDAAVTRSRVRSEADGRIEGVIGVGGLPPGAHEFVVELEFLGDGTLAPCRTSLVVDVTII